MFFGIFRVVGLFRRWVRGWVRSREIMSKGGRVGSLDLRELVDKSGRY